jgi:predicted dinucleotide-binding enzyme
MFGVRNPDDPKCASLEAVQTNKFATAAADVVVLCTPWQSAGGGGRSTALIR